ncbi:MAG: hypothetical protein LBR45_01075 [Bacteroidales bacterium]|jgi:hypothetical protein|nr:hypothetical protein [Bacteroidales bacterium]
MKNTLPVLLFFMFLNPLNAQFTNQEEIKKTNAATQKIQQEYDEKRKQDEERDRNLSLNDILSYLQSKDANATSMALTTRGYTIRSMNEDPSSHQQEGFPRLLQVMFWDNEQNSFYWYSYTGGIDQPAISYRIGDNMQLTMLQQELLEKGFSEISVDNALVKTAGNHYQNDLYEVVCRMNNGVAEFFIFSRPAIEKFKQKQAERAAAKQGATKGEVKVITE